jgi:hypothetical protein
VWRAGAVARWQRARAAIISMKLLSANPRGDDVAVDVAGEAGGGDLALVDSHVEAAAYRSSGAGAQSGGGDVAVARHRCADGQARQAHEITRFTMCGRLSRPRRPCVTLGWRSPATTPPTAWRGRRPGSTSRRTCARHPLMPSHAACAGSEVPAARPHRDRTAARRCSPATFSPHSVPRVRWSPSPCGRLSRPRSTTAPLPRPGGNSGRCACPDPEGPAGTAGTLPTFTMIRSAGSAPSYTPVASPRGTATRRAASPARWDSGRERRAPSDKEHRAPRQPIAASFGAGDESRGFNHWFGFPVPFCLACPPGPLAATRRYVVEAAPTRTSPPREPGCLQLQPAIAATGGGPRCPPGLMAPRGAQPSSSSTTSSVRA